MKNYTSKFNQDCTWFWTVTETYTDYRWFEITKTTDQSRTTKITTYNKEAKRKLFQEIWLPYQDYIEQYDSEWKVIAIVEFENWKFVLKSKEQVDIEIEEMLSFWDLED